MFRTANSRRLMQAALISFFLALGACDSGEPDTGATGSGAPDTGVNASASSDASSSEAAGADAERPVDSETLPYAEVNDELVYGHFAFPSDMIEPLPAIIVIHDWWGLNDDTRAAANRLAAEGYMVLAIDLYGGEVVDSAAAARVKMIAVVENTQLVEDNIRQALEFVGIAGAPTKASLGWGFGGAWALNVAMSFPDQLDAAVILYGQVTSDEGSLQAIEAPVLGLFGARDRGVTIETVNAFEAAMQRLRKDLDIHVYAESGHAFADPARSTFDADVAEDSWQRATDFLAINLVPEDES